MRLALNTAALDAFIKGKVKELSGETQAKILRGVAIAAYKDAVRRVPQYSGHMAANLRISVNGEPMEYSGKFVPENWREIKNPKQRGDQAAVSESNMKNAWVNSYQPNITDTFSIGYADGAQSEYFESVEVAAVNLRDVNQPSHAIELGYAYAKRRFNTFGRRKELEFEKI